jgi:C4-dicarboxylate transporter, DctM subunit
MHAEIQPTTGSRAAIARVLQWLDDRVAYGEGWLLTFALIASALLCSTSVILRVFGAPSSGWFDILPRYLTLFIGIFGASLATRDNKHIAIDLLTRLLSPEMLRFSQWFANAVAFGVCALLYVVTAAHTALEFQSGSNVLGVLPSWLPVVVMPIGFVVLGCRFLLQAGKLYIGSALFLPWLLLLVHRVPTTMLSYVLSAALALGVLCGAPLFVVLAGLALLLTHLAASSELAVVSVNMFQLTEAPALVTLPLFTLLGAVLAKSQAPQRLVQVARAYFGTFPGGLLVATVVLCAFFTTFTGASGVTIVALGLLLQQMLRTQGYRDRQSIGLITASGSIGLLFAPALPLILYGVVAKVDIDKMFLAGIMPGCLLICAIGGAAVLLTRKEGVQKIPFTASQALQTTRIAVWDLALPLIVLGLFLSGVATVVEASALGLLYVFFVTFVVHRDVRLKDLRALCAESSVLIGGVLVIILGALAFTGYLVDAEIPQKLVTWITRYISGRGTFLLAINLLLLVVGCLLDIFSALLIFVPLLLPAATAFGVHPVHFGIVFLTNLELGYLTPPVGMNLFLSSYRFERPLPEIWRSSAPYLIILLMALMVITYVPQLSLMFLD